MLLPLWDSVIDFFCCALRFVHSSFAIILMGNRERAVCFALFVFLMSRDCCVAHPHGAAGSSAVGDCGISLLYSLTFLAIFVLLKTFRFSFNA